MMETLTHLSSRNRVMTVYVLNFGLALAAHQVFLLSPQGNTLRCPLMHGLAQNLKFISLNLPIFVQITACKDRVRLGAKMGQVFGPGDAIL